MKSLLAGVGRYLLTAWRWSRNGCGFVWKAAWGAHVPLIWHVVVVILAAGGTYYLTPKISEQLERQKIRSSYISANLAEMNKLIGDFYVAIMQAVVEEDSIKAAEKFSRVDEIGARLSWKSIEIGAVLPSEQDRLLLKKFQEKLLEVQTTAIAARNSGNRTAFRKSLGEFAATSVTLIQGVSQRAELSISQEQTAQRLPR